MVSIACFAVTILFGYLAFCAVHRWLFSPLSSIPGPWYAAVSDFWLLTHVVRLQQCKTVQRLFDTYGPVVRVGPKKVVFCDADTRTNVYAALKFDKSSFYKSLLTNNSDHAMTTLPHSEHASRKKAYAPHYVPVHLNLFQPELNDFTLELVDIFDQAGGKTTFECLNVFRHLMFDVVAMNAYGCHVGALKNLSKGIEQPLCTAVEDFPKRGIIRGAVPAWAWEMVCSIPNARWRQLCDSDKTISDFIGARVSEMRSQMNSGKFVDPEKKSMLQRLIQYRNSSTNEPMSDQHIVSEAVGHTVAGVDTTSTTLAYLFWELSRRPEIMQKLRAEVDEVMPDNRSVPDISALFRLPYLTGFIKEGLRIYGAAPSLLERVVPANTGKKDATDDLFNLMGYSLPPNTVVATQAWSLHRNASVFPSPETFLPERWLETADNAAELVDMNHQMMPFGVGSRLCGGQNLAQMMLRIVLVSVVRNFNIIAPPETNDRSMEMRDAFVMFPASLECKLRFVSRSI